VPEVTLTSWLDGINKTFAEKAGIPVEDYSAQTGGELIGNLFEFITNLFGKGWLSVGVQFTTGLISTLYAIYGKNVPTRLRKELLGIGVHELLRIIQLTPDKVKEAKETLKDAIDSISRGDLNAFLASGLRSPTEVQTTVQALTGLFFGGSSSGSGFTSPTPETGTPAPTPKPPRKVTPSFTNPVD